jgi:hypothetical protein
LPTADIVVTTIFEPAWLDGYLDNIAAHGHTDSVTIRIICDRKSPPGVYAAARDAAARGFSIDCPDLDEQERYLKRLAVPEDFIPWNTDNRRNIGFLRAWEHGTDVLITIDDDNYCRSDSDFVAAHSVVGNRAADGPDAQCVSGASWFNICSMLSDDLGSPIWARGFPYAERNDQRPVLTGPPSHEVADAKIAVNAGLWLDDPDVDAVTRLAQRPYVDSADETDVILAPGTWTPINTQNTALHGEALPAYYYVRMGFPVKGMLIDRYGDIWSGYFLQRCAEDLGEVTRIGAPVADHRRTTHNLFKDLYHELAGITLTEELLPWLRELRLSASTYAEAYAELADAIAEQAERFDGFLWDEGGREFLRATSNHMRTWLRAIDTLRGA